MSILLKVVPWVNGANIYEVNVRQYTPEGTLNAFADHLPRLKSMGIKILWFMPLTPISLEKRKGTWGSYYASSSYNEIDPIYGTSDDFINIVKKAHQLGLKVMIDWVANHTGYDHEWTKTFPYFYHRDAKGNFTRMHEWEDVIDLNYSLPEVREEMIRSMQYWITEFDIDGFRCDMARTVPLDFWAEARAKCDALKPLLWLAECEIFSYHDVFDLTYGWEAMRSLDKYFSTGEISLDKIKAILKSYAEYPEGTGKLLFTSNHDENTYYGTEYEKYGLAAQAVAVFTCTWPGIPLIYSGQELPNKRRLSFFEKDEIKWTGNFELHNFYKTLLNLRTQNKALHQNASVHILNTNTPDILAYLCQKENDQVLVLLNFGKVEISFEFTHPDINGSYWDLFEKTEVTLQSRLQFILETGGFKVYHKSFKVNISR